MHFVVKTISNLFKFNKFHLKSRSETWCITCKRLDLDKIKEQDLDKHEKSELKRKIKKHEYVGEIGHSAYERRWEHLNDLAQLRTSSHMYWST